MSWIGNFSQRGNFSQCKSSIKPFMFFSFYLMISCCIEIMYLQLFLRNFVVLLGLIAFTFLSQCGKTCYRFVLPGGSVACTFQVKYFVDKRQIWIVINRYWIHNYIVKSGTTVVGEDRITGRTADCVEYYSVFVALRTKQWHKIRPGDKKMVNDWTRKKLLIFDMKPLTHIKFS